MVWKALLQQIYKHGLGIKLHHLVCINDFSTSFNINNHFIFQFEGHSYFEKQVLLFGL